jgi:hypothetical protein
MQGSHAEQINRKDEDGRTALHWAAANKPTPGKMHAECVEHLIKVGAKVNTHDDGGWTPFMSACSAGHVQVCASERSVGRLLSFHANRRTFFLSLFLSHPQTPPHTLTHSRPFHSLTRIHSESLTGGASADYSAS